MLQVSICVGSSCHLKGSYQIIKIFEELIRAQNLEDKVELKASFCLGQCTKGVSVRVGETFLDNINTSNARDMFEKHILKKVIL